MSGKPFSTRSLAIYTLLQAGTLVLCWGWFAALWSVAFFGFTLADIEWWLLVAAASAGLYGLRPNLERAIDRAWLGNPGGTQQVEARVAQLKPIKRRIDVLFSLIVLVILLGLLLGWFTGLFSPLLPRRAL